MFEQLLKHLEEKIEQNNRERDELGAPPSQFAEIRVLGQFALLANPDLPKELRIRATLDVDATIHGDSTVAALFRDAVKGLGLELDSLSSEVWIPPGAKFLPIYESYTFRVSVLDPISTLVSKAVKAPEKNKILIRDALRIYGAELSDRLKEYDVKLEQFKDAGLER